MFFLTFFAGHGDICSGDWLRADLALHVKRLESGKPADRAGVRQQVGRWLTDTPLAGVRGAEAIARLPAWERPAWEKFWAEVAALQNKAREQTK
jgi:hypothetical protein